MSDYPVAIAELRVMADYFVSAELPYFEELREAFKLLRHTGCRIQEIFDISRWEVSSGYTVIVQPQKGNNTRTVILNSDFDNFLAAITGQYSPFLGRTYSQLQGLFYKINPYGKLYSATKEITNYFFRYLFVRELDELGMTLQQIADEMGYTSTTAVNNYLNADLGSTIEVPVDNGFVFEGESYPIITIGNLKWTAKNLTFTDNTAGIRYPNNNINNVPDYGYLYSPEKAMSFINLLPANWRIPTDLDYAALGAYLVANSYNSHALRSIGSAFWTTSTGTDIFGFDGRGAGWYSSQYLLFKTYQMFFATVNPGLNQYARFGLAPALTSLRKWSFTGLQPYGLSLRFCSEV